MNRKLKLLLFISLPLVGLITGYLLMGRTVTAVVNGEEIKIRTRALKVSGALASAGISFTVDDQVIPVANTWLSKANSIEVNSARHVRILVEPEGELLDLTTASLIPLEILSQAGIKPQSTDLILMDGRPAPLDELMAARGEVLLQYRPAVNLTITIDGEERIFTTTAPDLNTALWEAGIFLREGDRLTPPGSTALTRDIEVEILTGGFLVITADGKTFEGYSAAETVGAALAENGIALQDLDYSQPAMSEPLPADGVIRVVRVTEELLVQQSAVPYETELLADDTLELGERKVETEGAVGLSAEQVRVRYEDGEEVSRVNEGSILIAEPIKRVVYYGSKIVDKYLDTPDGPITYYFTANVTATSYSPCRSGVEGVCYTGTSYGLPVQKGVIGVHRDWYYMFRGTQIYVPGYGIGTIADIGYYPYNDYWIDLGYSDDDYVSWGATNLTIYFLSPAPPGFTGVLP